MKQTKKNKQNEKVLEILRKAIDESEKKRGKKVLGSTTIKLIVSILEGYLKTHKFVCYGGTAINNILPTHDQFYNKDIEIPDYDFYSPNALQDAKNLANLYYSKGFDEVEAKAGVHSGTYKVYVNFIPIADITQLDPKLYNAIKREAITINGINYAPANFLRMNAYLELSRPDGDTSRWEKVLKRLTLLNKHYPINETKCDIGSFIRNFEDKSADVDTIYKVIKNSIINQGLVFFGGFAIHAYGRYLPPAQRKKLVQYPDFDVLALDAEKAANHIKKDLEKHGLQDVTINLKPGVGEIIAPHYEVKVGKEEVVFVYTPLECHSYNTIKINNKKIKIATIDTMLNFYLAFLYAHRDYYDEHRILCVAQYLFYVQNKNRLAQKGVLKRFSTTCYGKQSTLENIRHNKAEKFKELKGKKNREEYEKHFLRYIPFNNYLKNKNKKEKLVFVYSKKKRPFKKTKTKTRKHK